MRARTFQILIVLAVLFPVGGCAPQTRELAILTDAAAGRVEGRLGTDLGNGWTAGGLASWYADDVGPEWSAGMYATLAVDPNASIPLAGWLPALGDWLNVPESLTGEGYLIGKVELLPWADRDPGLAGSVGAGIGVGPGVAEFVYRIVESGRAEPLDTSGPMLFYGLRF